MDTEYIAISVATLRSGNAIGTDLYSHDPITSQMRLYKKSDYPLKDDDLQRLLTRGIRRLYITQGGVDRYQEYLRRILINADGDVSLSARVGALNEVVRDVLRERLNARDIDRTVRSISNLGTVVVNVLCDERFVASDLMRILYHDYTTFTHSANVAYYAVLLARTLGTSLGELRQIGTGALLHDLGKVEISDTILSKPGRLDEFEYRRVKQHPLDGFRQLCNQPSLTQGQLMMVYQHHERLDGSGYPVGCVGDEIHPWARLCAVVDAFEALTSSRPYRPSKKHEQALSVMEQHCGQAFDPEMFQCWKQIIQSCSLA